MFIEGCFEVLLPVLGRDGLWQIVSAGLVLWVF